MTDPIRRAVFADLVFNQAGQVVQVVDIGGVPHYAVPDGDFMRHVEAEYVDRQIVTLIQERIRPMKDLIADQMVEVLQQEELFTRASVGFAIDNLDRILEPGNVDVDELRMALWMAKFRAVVDVHGDVVQLDLPGFEGEAPE